MVQSWDLEATRTLAGRQFEDDEVAHAQVALLRPCLNSIAQRRFFANYHFFECKRLLRENIDEKLPHPPIFDIRYQFDPEHQAEMTACELRAAAHVVACLQNLHCLADTLAHVVWYAYGLNRIPEPIEEHRVTISRVTTALKSKERYGGVRKALKELLGDSDFSYLDAVVNRSKHRSVIAPNLVFDMRDEERPTYYLELPAFRHKKVEHHALVVDQSLEPLYLSIVAKVIACGNALNDSLLADA